MKSSRSGSERCRIRSARKSTVPLSTATTTNSRPAKSRWIARDSSRMRAAICAWEIRILCISPRQRAGARSEASICARGVLNFGVTRAGRWGIDLVRLQPSFQFQLQVNGVGARIVAVSPAVFEAQRTIQCNRLFHRSERVQSQCPVPRLPRLVDDGGCQFSAETLQAKRAAHIEPFHFANAFPDFAQRDAPRGAGGGQRDQQTSIGRSVPARQLRQFLLEILEAQVDADGLLVFHKQFARLAK